MMKDFPINELLSATEIEHLINCVGHIFGHLKKTTRNSAYPIPRYLRLVEAISRDLCDKVLSISQRKRLMYLDFDDFDKVTQDCKKAFYSWEEQFEQFRESLRDLARKRGQDRLPLKV
jgi:dynein heavy chain 1